MAIICSYQKFPTDIPDIRFRSVLAYSRGADGRLYFGGDNGLNGFDPTQLVSPQLAPELVLTNFLLFYKPVDWSEPNSPLLRPINDTELVKLSYRQNFFGFEFAMLDFADPSSNGYSFMLEGLDDRWRSASADRRFATYTDLGPGRYNFRVKGRNKYGTWSQHERVIKVIVYPPPWRTWWAYSLYILAGVSGIYFYLRYQQNRLVHKRLENVRLERKVNERTHALKEKNREILANQAQLVTQAEQLANQARQLSQLDELKTRFFTNISHEFRTPLTLTIGPLEDLFAAGSVPENLREKLTLVLSNIHRIKKLIDELLDLAKLEAGQMQLYPRLANVVASVRQNLQAFKPLAQRKKITLSSVSEKENIPLYLDLEKFEKIIFNLLSNSFKFTPAGGRITVVIDDSKEDAVTISVADTGAGIPKGETAFVFDRFYQVENPVRGGSTGTGIGLSLVRELIALHGGTIEVTSDVGTGCEFTLRLPKGTAHLDERQLGSSLQRSEETSQQLPVGALYEMAPPSPEISKVPDTSFNSGPKPSVLIIEDHGDVRAYLRENLTAGYRIFEAADGAGGLALAKKHLPDLVLSDIMMPGMDGLELCRRLKSDQKTSHIPVILLTAKASTENKVTGLETGADDYLVKPFNARILKSRIGNLIESRRQLRERFRQENGHQTLGITHLLGRSKISAKGHGNHGATYAHKSFWRL